MTEFWALIILGIIQGLTEFLPVSSSGHLVLLSNFFNLPDSLFVSIVLHVATLFSVIYVLKNEVFDIIKHPFSDQSKKLIVATIPTCLIVLLIYPFISDSFEGKLLPICFLITALLLLITDIIIKRRKYKCFVEKNLTYKQVIIMGIVQGFATLPGISRSGSTICGGILSGGDRKNVAKFSFLMSLPIIVLSMCLEIYKLSKSGMDIAISLHGLIIAFILAFIIGVLSIKFMIKITENVSFKWFSFYLAGLAILTLLL